MAQGRFPTLLRLLVLVSMVLSSLGVSVAPARADNAGTALQFNGSSQYVTFGQATTTLGVTTFTLEAWVKRDDTGGKTMGTGTGGLVNMYPIITKGMGEGETPANLNMNYFLGIDNTGKIGADFEDTINGGNHPVNGTNAVPANAWHHIAATYDGQTWKLYIDGVLDKTLTLSSAFTPESSSIQHAALASSLQSSGNPNSSTSGYWKGVIDEARIWNLARTQSEIQADMNKELTSGTGLIGRWGLNEGSGTTANNSIAGRPSGTLINSPTWVNGFPLPDTIAPAAPTGLSAAAYSGGVNLTWNANTETDLAGYNLYRSTTAGGPYTKVNASLINVTNYTDGGLTNGTPYYYVVKAVDNSTNESGASGEVSATPLESLGAGLQFDGTNDYVTFGNAAGLGLLTFTLETWFYWTGGGDTVSTGTGGLEGANVAIPLVTKGRGEGDGSNLDMNYFFGLSNGKLAADFEEDETGPNADGLNHPVIGNTVVIANVWHHGAVTYDGQVWRLYLDGVLDKTLDLGTQLWPRDDSIQHAGLATAMTSTGVTDGFFQGKLDEARIWNVARSAAEIKATINSALTSGSGLIARWGMNEGTGTTIASSIGSFPGTLTNGPLWGPGAPFNIVFDTTPPAAPTLLTASGGSGLVNLDWADNTETDLAGYNVYRGTVSGTYAKVNSALVTPSQYVDTGLTNLQEYFYVVRAVDTSGNESGDSNEAYAIPMEDLGSALAFTGANTYVTFGDPAKLDLAQFTIETWFKRTGAGTPVTTGGGGIEKAVPLVAHGAQQSEGGTVDANWMLVIDDNADVIAADFEDMASGANHPVYGTTAILDNVWHHAAATYDGATWKLYLDGKLDATLAVGAAPRSDTAQQASLATMLNTTGGTNGFFQGALDEPRVWNRALTQAEIIANINKQITTGSGLVARWGLNEGSGTVVNDSVATTANGTVTGTAYQWVPGAPFNINVTPGVPALVVPANGATNVAVPPTLTVHVTDPTNSPLNVAFYGRPKIPPPGPDFSLIVIPDPQYYAASYPAIYNGQMNWAVTNKTAKNIPYVLSLGDNVDTVGNTSQWTTAATAWDILTTGGLPYGLTLGNHDGAPSNTANFNATFGSRLTAQATYGGRYGTSDYDNTYATFSASGMDFIVLFLEYDTSMSSVGGVLDWANGVLQANPGRRAIVVYHDLLTDSSTFSTQGNYIYQALKGNANLFLIMGGHLDNSKQRTDVFEGRKVYSLRSDYQFLDGQQSGYLRIMRFSPADNKIYVTTYSPNQDKYLTDGTNQFSLDYAMASTAAFTLIGTNTNVTPGTTGTDTSVTWDGLASGTEYEWYAVSSNSAESAASATWSFTTGTASNLPPEITEGASTTVTMSEDGAPTAFGLTLHATDADNDTLTWSLGTPPAAHGTAGASGTGASQVVTYTPAANYNGSDSFAVQVSDGKGGTDSITVYVTIEAVNDAPVCQSVTLTIDQDTMGEVSPNCTDVENNPLTYVIASPATHGTAAVTVGGKLSYTPNAGYVGTDAFTYKANDGTADSNAANVGVTVNAVNHPPVVTNPGDQLNAEGSTIALQVQASDTDVPPQTLTYSATNLPEGLTINTATGLIGGTISYHAAAGSPYNATVSASDGTASDTELFQWRVTNAASGLCGSDAGLVACWSMEEGSGAWVIDATANGNDGAITGSPTWASGHNGQALNLSGSGQYASVPDNDRLDIGTNRITLAAWIKPTKATLATQNIIKKTLGTTTANGYELSLGTSGKVFTRFNGSSTYRVDSNTAYPLGGAAWMHIAATYDGATIRLYINGVEENPKAASFTIAPNGTNLGIGAEPAASPLNYFQGLIDDARVYDRVLSPEEIQGLAGLNRAPVAVGDSYGTAEDTQLNVAAPGVLWNDMDADGNPLTAVKVTGPGHGTVTLNADGSFTYSPAPNYNGADSFTYKANDGTLDSNVVTVNINVTAVNDPPVAVGDSYTATEDAMLTVNALAGVLANDTDVDGNPLTAVKVSEPGHGAVTLNADGSFTYSPAANYNGPDSFTYKANDGTVDSNVVTVSINVTAVNDPPVCQAVAISTNEDTTGQVAWNCSDIDSTTLTPSIVSQPLHGGASVDGANLVYSPSANYYGGDAFTYKVNDGELDSNIATATADVAAVNDAPVAGNDGYLTPEDTELVVTAPGVLGNDSDVDGNAITAVLVAGPQHGELMLNPDGSFTYMPDQGFFSIDSFTYKANDGTTDSNTATVTIDVGAVNDPPTAVDDNYSVAEDGTLNVAAPGVLGNDSDPEHDALTAAVQTQPGHGALTLNSDGSFTYTPEANFNGSDSFTYKASDGELLSDAAAVNLTVTSVNDAPVCQALTLATDEDTAAEIAPVCSDIDGDSLTVSIAGQPEHGAASMDAGKLRYAPAADYHGTDSFTYKASDGQVESAAATVGVTVNPVNDAPLCSTVQITTNEDTAGQADPACVDADGDTLSYAVVTPPANGAASVAAGKLSYTPNANTNGADSFTYKANDGTVDSNTATANVTVSAVNDPPVVTKPANQTNAEGETASLQVQASDVDNASLTYAATNLPDGLSINAATGLIGGKLTYHAAANSPYNVTVSADDGSGAVSQSFTWTVTNVASGLCENDATLVGCWPMEENGGSAAIDATANGNDGALQGTAPFVWTAGHRGAYALKLNSPSVSDQYARAAHSTSLDIAGPITLAAWVKPEKAATQYLIKKATATTGYELSLSQTKDAGDPTSQRIFVRFNGNAVYRLDSTNPYPADGATWIHVAATYDGTTTNLYINGVLDKSGTGPSSIATNTSPLGIGAQGDGTSKFQGALDDVRIYNRALSLTEIQTLAGANHFPTAVTDSYGAAEDTTLNVAAPGVLGNDTDPDGNPLTAVKVSEAGHGAVTLNSDGSFSYTPAANYYGSDSFTYKANDGQADSNVVTVSIEVTGVNDAPVAVNDNYTAAEDQVLTVNALAGVLSNDTDAEGSTLSASLASGPAHGSLTLNGDGSFSYTPVANYNGADSFTYRANDGSLDSNVATVSITVDAVNDAPVCQGVTLTTDEDTTGQVTPNCSDVDADTLTFLIGGQPIHGAASVVSGRLSYTPNANYYGPDAFTYKANDGKVDSAAATVSVTVTAANDAPVLASIGNQAGAEGSAVTFTAHATDADADTLVYSLVDGATGKVPAGATLDGASGAFAWTPAEAQGPGSYTFDVCVSDGSATDCETITVTVSEVNQAPAVTDPGDQTSTEGAVVSLAIMASDGDLPANTLTFGATGLPGGLSIDPQTGLISGTIAGGASVGSPYSVVVTVDDGKGGTDTAEFTWSVTAPGPCGSDPALVACYLLNEGTDNVAHDGGALPANDMTLAGGPTWTPGVSGGALSFDGATQYGTTPDEASLDIANQLTLAAWIRPSKYDTQDLIKKATNGSVGGYELTLATTKSDNSSQRPFFRLNQAPSSDTYRVNATTMYPIDGTWMHVAGTYDGAVMRLYVNGVEENHLDASIAIVTNGDPLTLGAQKDGSRKFQGALDDVRVYNRALSAAEIAALANRPPVAVNDSYTTDVDAVLTVPAPGVLSNDTDANGDMLTAAKVSDPLHGSLTFNGNGSFTYTPASGYEGPDTFTYKANDGKADSNVATVNLTIAQPNQPPVLAPLGGKTVDEGVLLTFTASATDPDTGDTLTYSLDPGAPAGASIDPGTGAFTWTPAEAQGPGQYNVTVRVTDSRRGSDFEAIVIDVNEVNAAPTVTNPGNQASAEGDLVALPITATDADVPANVLSYGATALPAGLSIDPATGLISGAIAVGAASGSPYAVTVTVNDGQGGATPVSFQWTVTVAPPPACGDDPALVVCYLMDEGSGTVAHDGGALPANPATLVNGPTWAAGHSGQAVHFDGTDDYGTSPDEASLDIVNKITIAAWIKADRYATQDLVKKTGGNAGYELTLATSDTSSPSPKKVFVRFNQSDTLRVASTTDYPVDGVTWLHAVATYDGVTIRLYINGVEEGSKAAAFTIATNDIPLRLAADSAPSRFYQGALDDVRIYNRALSAAEVLALYSGNHAPVANADTYNTPQDTALNQGAPGVLSNDTDADGDTLTANKLTDPAHGTVALAANGSFTYTPQAGYSGPDSFTYKANDGKADSAAATVTINVTPHVNHDPVLSPIGAKSGDEGTLLTFKAAASDEDGDTLTFSLDSGAPAGASIDPSTGVFTWTPTEAQGAGSYLVTVRVTDSYGASDFETITVTVDEVNVAPVVTNPGSQSSVEGDVVSLAVVASDADLPANTLTFSATGLPAGLSINPQTGLISGTIAADAADGSPYSVQVTASDGALSSTVTFAWTVSEGVVRPTGLSCTNLDPVPLTAGTGEKPQSKVWQYDGAWWAVFPTSASGPNPAGTYLWKLQGVTWTRVLNLSTATNAKADVKPAGAVVHILLYTSGAAQLVSVQYGGGTYQLWPERMTAAAISLPNSEIATIDIDTKGRMWLASENDATDQIVAYHSDSPYGTWSGPVTVATGINDDDIAVVTRLPGLNQVGVLWSNQNTKRFGFKTHNDGTDPAAWSTDEVPASQSALSVGAGMADDHLNVATTSDGTLYAAVKTSYDAAGYPKVALLVRRPGGTWDDLYEVAQSGTRAIVEVDEANGVLNVIYTSSEGYNDILYRQSPLGAITFGAETTMRTGAFNDASSTKANYTAEFVVIFGSSSQVGGEICKPLGAVPQPPVVRVEKVGLDVRLWWDPVTKDVNGDNTTVTRYQVYRSLKPYFRPGDDTALLPVKQVEGTEALDWGVIGNVDGNYYVVRAVNAAGPSADSNRVGKFTFGLTAGSGQ